MIALIIILFKTAKLQCHPASRSLLYIGLNERLSFISCFCTSNKDDGSKNLKLPEEPQNCCMSGCANCVWVAYANELAKIMNDGGETAKAKIMEHVKDPNLRAFLMLELHHLFKNKQDKK